MKKIGVFENEINIIEGSFEAMNLLFYNNQLQIEYYMNSQDGLPYEKFKDYNVIIVDMQLSPKSDLDGIGIIKELTTLIGKNKLVVLTGFSTTERILKSEGLTDIPILTKPVDYLTLHDKLRKYLA